jgi:hypothetical protein
MENCKIVYLSQITRKIETKIFQGENAFHDAIIWGKDNIENFSVELIQFI